MLSNYVLTPIRGDFYNTAAGVRRPEVAGAFGKDTFWPLKILADKFNICMVHLKTVDRITCHYVLPIGASTLEPFLKPTCEVLVRSRRPMIYANCAFTKSARK